jgi:hypothetical protein
MHGPMKGVWAMAAFLVLLPALAAAQDGQIAGTVRDTLGGVMPGVLVEVTSPALIEKTRSATTDGTGQYRIINLPVGVYSLTFSLEGFATQKRDNIELTSGFTAPINGEMSVGQRSETVTVKAETPTVDVQNARQAITFTGESLADLPTARNVNSLLALTPGISSGYQPGTLTGVCSGGVGVFCNPGIVGFNVGELNTTGTLGANNASQGRILVDGQVVNSGAALPIVGQTGGYTADIANAQEITIQLSGALGESETGGSSINIVPRTGGNKFAGNANMTYTRAAWFGANNGAYPNLPAVFQSVISDHDISGALGGPIKRDRLWFYAVARDQGIHKLPVGIDFWPNLWAGKWGYNYQPDRSQPRVDYQNLWRNANGRVTYQATQKNKFNLFWDQQDFCQDPCLGVVSVFTSPESWWSVQTPNRLAQASWTSPVTNKLLLEAGLTAQGEHYDTTFHREYTNPVGIPRVIEVGDTAGGDSVASRVNQFAGTGFFALTSGSLNSEINNGGSEKRDANSYRTHASATYVTGRHNAKVGYDGGYYTQLQVNNVNDPRMTYNYIWPGLTANCSVPGVCGNTSLQFPSDPNNLARRPVPNNVIFNTGVGQLHDHVMYTAFYAQDQWTTKRLTLSGAVRYDHATSGYGQTCIGPDKFVPKQTNGSMSYCVPATDGVSFHDITPRMGAAWDVFGKGKTSIKWNLGKYLNAAGISSTNIYGNANPARRTVNLLQRAWHDDNGNRIVDCNLMDFNPNGECGGFIFTPGPNPTNDTARFGLDPLGLDAAGIPIGLATTQCGRREAGIPAAVQAYCNQYGESLLNGWNRRQNEWQLGIGIQHEILPRLSGEITYNRRMYGNLTVTDQLGIGCDRYNGAQALQACLAGNLQYTNASYDFYSVTAPKDPRLPGGGGYQILGLTTPKTTLPVGQPQVQTLMPELQYSWNGVDTNFVWRGPGGFRINGGTSTGRTQRNTCSTSLDAPQVVGRAGAEFMGASAGTGLPGGCINNTPFQTRVNGTASYTIPKVDVLVATVFQSFAGVARNALVTFSKDQVIWGPGSLARATAPCAVAANGVGCLGNTSNDTTVQVNLFNNNELWGDRVTLIDLKLAKVIRFKGKRATLGADIYNLFNSDSIQGYDNNYVVGATGAAQTWGNPTSLVSPRFVRLSLQANF